MEAIDPGHANRLLNYNRDPAKPPASVTVSQELRQWYDKSVGEILAPPIAENEIGELTLFFSSLDDAELLALYGLEQAGRWARTSEAQEVLQQITKAFPVATVASKTEYKGIEQVVQDRRNLARILQPRRGFLRSAVTTDETAKNYRLSKGAIHTHYTGAYTDTAYEYSEVHQSDIALLTSHEVLIRRLAKHPSTRHTKLPFEHSRARRWLEEQEHLFSDIDAARQFVGKIAAEGFFIPNMNEVYQQGLLSILQNCSLFPDVFARFRANDCAGFIAMQEKITQFWPMPGAHGAFAQCGFVFEPDLLHYDGNKVHVASKLEEGLAELPRVLDKLDLGGELQVPLYVGPRTTVAFRPIDLPNSSEDSRAIKGKLKFYAPGSPFKQRIHSRCAALAGQESLVAIMAALAYDHAKALEQTDTAVDVIEFDNEKLFQLTDTPEFRQRISPEERESWRDEDGTDLIENGAFRNPELRDTYLVETVKPVLLQLGREAVEQTLRTIVTVTPTHRGA